MVEIRVITYKRPHLLLRALNSILSQTDTKWRAVVFDDSRDFESKAVVEALGDSRIEARQNPRNFGMVGNLSQAFESEALFHGSTHACILEDDNAFDPQWLEANLRAMSTHPCRVMCRNYRVVDVLPDGTLQPTSREPMREIYGDSSRYLDYQERIKEAFFSFTIGTSCFFWDVRSGIDLSITCEQVHGQLIEPIRSTCFRDPCWYEPEPLSSFSRFLDKSQTPRGETKSSTIRRRIAKVSEIMFTRHLMLTWQDEFRRPMDEILSAAALRVDGDLALQHLAEARCMAAFSRLKGGHRRIAAVKSWLVGLLYRSAWRNVNSSARLSA